jgi:hypothetical protein
MFVYFTKLKTAKYYTGSIDILTKQKVRIEEVRYSWG